MRFRRAWSAPLAALLAALASGGWVLQAAGAGGSALQAALFESVLRHVAEGYVEEIDPGTLYELAVDGLLLEIGDPYAAYIRPEDHDAALLSNTYGGVGLKILAEDDGITIIEVLPNSPASKLDLKAEDRILEVDGASVAGWSQEDAIGALRGPKGDPVEVAVRREDRAGLLRLTIVRDEVHIVAVQSLLLDDEIGYARLEQFSQSARRELEAAVNDLLANGARSLILDLRYNPGGILREGVEIADLFLDAGDLVVDTRSRTPGDSRSITAPGPDRYPGLPVVVLVNRFSASASEIVAGALQDHDRALVLGTRTLGKGVMQGVFPLPGGSYLRLTTGTWFTPAGRSIHAGRRAGSEGRREHADLVLGSEAFGAAVEEAIQLGALPTRGDEGAEADTVGQPVYHTMSGRPVYGGGGIAPDVIVAPDTLSSDEQELRRVLVEADVPFSDLAFRFAVRYRRLHPELPREFDVTPRLREAFIAYVQERTPAPLEPAVFEAAGALVDRQLARHIAVVAFGESEGLRRWLGANREVQEAKSLLREAATPEQLLALGEELRAKS